METDQLTSLPNTKPNDIENFIVQEYERQQSQGSPFIRLPGEVDPVKEDLDWTTWANITSFTSSPGAAIMKAVGSFQFFDKGDADFDGNEWIRQNYKDWKDRPEIITAINQGWFDDSKNPEHAQYNLTLAMGVNDTLAQAYKQNYDDFSSGLKAFTQQAGGMAWQLGGDPFNLLAGMGLAKVGYKGVTALKSINTAGAAGAAKTIAAGATAGAIGNLGYEEILKQLNPGTNYDPFGYEQELMALGFGAAFGGGLTAVGRAMRAAPGVPGVGAAMDRFRMNRLNKALDTIETEESFSLRDGRKGTFSIAAKESDQDLDLMIAGEKLEGVHSVAPLIPAASRKTMTKKINDLQAKADNEGWDLQVLRHPDQDVMDTFDLGNDLMNNPAFNRIASQDQLGGRLLDKAVSAVTGPYATVQSIVTPGARTAKRQISIIEDTYRTMSGSAHTLTQANAVNPFTNTKGATAEGYTSQLRKQTEALTTKIQKIYRTSRRDAKGVGLNYDGRTLETPMVGGQDNFETAVNDYIRRKHGQAIGYDVEVPTDVHPSILEAAAETEKYFTRMGDELVKAEMLPADNATLGGYMPVVFDHKLVRADREGFVNRMVEAFEERDVLTAGGNRSNQVVDDDVIAIMNQAAGRDLFYEVRGELGDIDAVPTPPRPTPRAPRAKQPLDEVAEEALDGVKRELEADPVGRPMRENEALDPDTGFRENPRDVPEDVSNGGYPLEDMKSSVYGAETTIYLPNGDKLSAYWALADAEDLRPSNNVYGSRTVQGGFPKDPDTAGWNHRADDYADPSGGSTSMQTHERMVANPDINRFFDLSTGTEVGTPIVTRSGYPDSGANRTMALQRLYQDPKFAAKLRAKAEEAAIKVGIDPDDIATNINNPVLVRVMKDPGEPGSISHLANQGYAAVESASSAARTMGKNIKPGTMDFIQSSFAGNEDATLRAMLGNSKFSNNLVNKMLADGAISEADMPRIWNNKTGNLTPEGKNTIQHMLAARVMNDFELPPGGKGFASRSVTDVLNAAKPAQLERFETVAHLIDQMKRLGYNRNTDLKFAGGLTMIDDAATKSLYAHSEWKDSGLTIEDYFFHQQVLPGMRPPTGYQTPVVAMLTKALDELGPKKLRTALTEASANMNSEGLFPGAGLGSPYQKIKDSFEAAGLDLSHKNFNMDKVTNPFENLETMKQTQLMDEYVAKNGLTADRFINSETGEYTPERAKLHEQIVDELLNLERAADENDIVLGKHGGLPVGGEVAVERQITVITGPAAAGKSTLVSEVATSLRALEMDSDIVKRKFKEYDNGQGVASVHDESKDVLDLAMNRAIENGQNIVVPKIGGSPRDIAKVTMKAQEAGYEVHVICVDMPQNKVMERLLYRFATTGRLVYPDLVANVHADNPTRAYEEMAKTGIAKRGNVQVELKSVRLMTADVPNSGPKFLPMKPDSWRGTGPDIRLKTKSGDKNLDTLVREFYDRNGRNISDETANRNQKLSRNESSPGTSVEGRGPRRGIHSGTTDAADAGKELDSESGIELHSRGDGVGRQSSKLSRGSSSGPRQLRVGQLPDNLREAYLRQLNESRVAQAKGIRDGILDPNKGHGVSMGMDHVPPPLRKRTLGINYATVNDFLDNQVSRMALRYDHQISGNIGIRRAIQLNPETWEQYRTSDGNRVKTAEDVIDVLDQQFNRMRRVADAAGDDKLVGKIDNLHSKARRDLVMPMEAMRGSNPVKGAIDPDDFLSFMGRTIQRYNFVNKLGSVGWAQLNDFAPVSLHLIQNPRSLAAVPRALGILRDMPTRDLELLGLWSDNMGRTRAITDIDFDVLDMGYGSGKTRAISAAIEAGLTKASDIGGHISGMNWITNANKRLAGILTIDRMGILSKKMLRAQRLMDGGMDTDTAMRKVRLSKYKAAKVNHLGLDVKNAQRFHRLIYAHGTDIKGKPIRDMMSYEKYLKNERKVFLPEIDDWDTSNPVNSTLLDNLRSRIDDEVNRHMVVTPGYFDRPLINFSTWGKLFNQFQTFMMAFQHQRLLPMSQMPAKYQAWYMANYMGLGAMTDTITNALSGRRSIEESVEEWQNNPAGMAYKAFVYSGLSGPINRVWGMTDALGIPLSPGVLLDNRVGGGASQGFYYGDPGAKTLIQALGPTASSAARAGDVIGDVLGPGDADRKTAYRAATLLPFQNQAILRMLYQGTGLPVVPEALKE